MKRIALAALVAITACRNEHGEYESESRIICKQVSTLTERQVSRGGLSEPYRVYDYTTESYGPGCPEIDALPAH